MRFLLIPTSDALPAMQARVADLPDGVPLSVDEHCQLLASAERFMALTEALCEYAEAVGGQPSPN